ncbi:2TM domain-containing protein [Maribacter sp. HTCC2170]|uniref:2TM domain-containing protein n=1 Tax=Maribacter sp. (strain HTCC2170 / KCCM 42371) TaxID=313603 RepID=UPI00006B48D0|nr:2TM domain-containing protein [Maribacter sp. HTCC2170]EAR01672.1 hypothetical protein FB2170_14128 [Maribacter sp. HTCC2170]
MEVIDDNNDRGKLKRAKKRVEELKGFYIHLTVYIMVNTFITTMKIMSDLGEGKSFTDVFFDFGTFAVWFFWGIGVFFHGAKVFSHNPILGKNWEEKQIQKYMEKDRNEAEKYR